MPEVIIAELPVEPAPVAAEIAIAQLPVEPNPVASEVIIAELPVEPAPVAAEIAIAELPVEPNPVVPEVIIAELPVEPAPVAAEIAIAQLPVEPNPVAPEVIIAELPVEPNPVVPEVVITQLPVEPAPVAPEVIIAELPVEPAPAPVAEIDITQLPVEPNPVATEVPNPQQTLSQEWQTLAALSLAQLKLTDFEPSVAHKISQAFQKYQEASTLAAIAPQVLQHPAESVASDVSPSQIEQQRLQSLQGLQKELDQLLAELGQHQTALESEIQKAWNEMEEQIPLAELNWMQANISLIPVFSSGYDSLQPLAALWQNAAAHQLQRLQSIRQKAELFEAQRQQYAALATAINPHLWQVVGYQRNACGRQGEIWSWVTDSPPLAQKNQYLSQAAIAAQNRQALETLARALQQSATLLWDAEFMENTRNSQEMVRQAAGVTLALIQPQQTESLNPQNAPEQSQLQVAGATAQGFPEMQSEVTAIQEKGAAKHRDLQTARFLLLYWQQLAARQAIQQLESVKIEVDIAMQQAGRALAQLRTFGH